MKKRVLSVVSALTTALLSYGFLSQAFSGAIQAESAKLQKQKAVLSQMQALVENRSEIERAWKAKEVLFKPLRRQEEGLNQWMRELTVYGQSQKIVFEKMEPLKKEEKSMRLFLSFQGTPKRLIQLLYFLFENQPLTRLESLIIEHDEEEGPFYELILRKKYHG